LNSGRAEGLASLPPNKPLERPGVIPRGDAGTRGAGRSAPSR